MPEKILSICIPTYNRPQLLREFLISIVKNLNSDDRDLLEIVITDNSDNLLTQDMVSQLGDDYPDIIYIKNNVNVGGPANIFAALDHSSGKYMWLMGDDDLVVSSKISQLILLLSKSTNATYILNFAQGNNANPKILTLNNCLNIKSDKVFYEKNEIFAGRDFINFFAINFMSVLIFSQENYKMIAEQGKKFINSCYPHAYLFLLIAESKLPIVRFSDVYVIWRSLADNRRYDYWQKSDDDIINQYIEYINYAGDRGFTFDRRYLRAVEKKREINIFYYQNNIWKRPVKKIISMLGLSYLTYRILAFYRYLKFLVKNND